MYFPTCCYYFYAIGYGESVDTIGYMGAACLVLPFIFIVVSIIFTENALKKKFDSFGHPKK